MVTKYRLACVLSVASIAISACSTSVAGEPAPASDTRATEKVATRHADSSAARYVDVSGQGVVKLDHQREQYGIPAPGVKIGRVSSSDPSGSAKCTLGPAVTTAARAGFLTAGHCADMPGTNQYAQVHFDGSAPLLLGPAEQAQDSPSPNGYTDSAVIWTGTVDPAATRIANTWPITGVMPVSEVKQLPAGTPICIDGAKSGVVCSPLISVGTDFIRSVSTVQHGDSGAAVFVVDQTGSATLLGIASRITDGQHEAAFLEPALQRLGATALTAH